MVTSTPQERCLLAANFLTNYLSSRERMLVAALALGYTHAQVAKAWCVSRPSVSQMARNIRQKAQMYWA